MSTELSIIPILKPDEKTYFALMSKNLDVSKEQLEATVLNEMYNLDYIVQLYKPEIADCEPITIANAFRFVINYNLSFDQSLGLIHLTTRNHIINKGKVGAERKVKVLEAKPTVNGLVSMCKQAGTLINVLPSTPEFDEKGYLKTVTINIQLPEYDSDGTLLNTKIVSKTYDLNFFKKREIASHRQNSIGNSDKANNKTLNRANALYSSYYPDAQGFKAQDYNDKGGIDPEFANTKAVRNFLEKLDKNPNAKVKKGTFHSKLFSEEKDEIIDGSFDEIRKEPCQKCGKDDYLADDVCESCRESSQAKKTNAMETQNASKILQEMESLKTAQEVKELYTKHKELADSVDGMKDRMLAKFKELDNQEKAPKPQPIKQSTKQINSDDL